MSSVRCFSYAACKTSAVFPGVIFLVPVLSMHPPKAHGGAVVEIRLAGQQSITYPVDSAKNVRVEIDAGKVRIESVK